VPERFPRHCRDGLPPVAYRAAIVLRRYFNAKSGTAWPSQQTLMVAMGMSRGGVQKALGKLVAHGHLAVEVNKGRGATNHYRPIVRKENAHGREHYEEENAYEREHFEGFNAHEREHLTEENAYGRRQGVPTGEAENAHVRRQGVPTGVGTEHIERTHLRNPVIEHEERSPSARYDIEPAAFDDDRDDAAIDAADTFDALDPFDEFWRSYPRKVAKGAARKAFAAALKKTDAATLIAGAARYGGATAQTEPRFIKHPASWLNGECWNDEPERPRGPLTLDAYGEPIEQPAPAAGYGHGRRLTHDEQVDLALAEVRERWERRKRMHL